MASAPGMEGQGSSFPAIPGSYCLSWLGGKYWRYADKGTADKGTEGILRRRATLWSSSHHLWILGAH